MRAFGFLSFGHYTNAQGSQARTAADMIRQAVEIGVGAEELGVNGAYFRVHHFARQQAAPIPLLTAIAAKTSRIEVGTGVIDLRYENPLYLAEEAAAHLNPLGVLVVEIGYNRDVLEMQYPQLPFTWLETAAGDEYVFMLQAADLPATI